jgi:energy-coupling factor transporter ATP-binding protein EcfA2
LNNNVYPLLQRHTDNISDSRSGNPIFTSFGNPRKFKLLSNIIDLENSDKILPPSHFIKNPEKSKSSYVKNPFGCKDEDVNETSALCIIGKSGSGKTTSTEEALELMGHEYLLYIPIEGEYTFSQYTGEGFEMSSLGEFMMMAHLLVDALDDKLPTSLSAKAYEFLRQETKFTKIVITDDMEMKAISDKYSTEEAATMAINAGADMLLYRNMEEAKKALAAIREAVKKKTLKREAVVEKALRIEKCKKENLAEYQPIYIPKIVDSFNTSEAKKLIDHFQTTLVAKA